MHELNELAAAYWEHHRLSASKNRADRLRSDEFFWAWEEVEELVASQPHDVIPTLVFLADAAPDDAVGYLGAGPVENLISHHGSEDVIDQVEAAARQNERFRIAVASAWYDDYVSSEVCARLRVFGGRTRRPDVEVATKKGSKKGAGSRSREHGPKRAQRGARGSGGRG